VTASGVPEGREAGAPAAAREIIEAGRALHRARLIAGAAGNLSTRLEGDSVLITRSGTDKGRLCAEDLVRVPLSGGGGGAPQRERPGEVHGVAAAGPASSEWPFHRAIYLARPDVGGVVHTHAPALVALCERGLRIEETLPEVPLATGPITSVPRLPSGSEELAAAVGGAAGEGAGVILLRGHGAVAVGSTVREAVGRMELAELAAYTVLLSQDGVPERSDLLEDLLAEVRRG